MTDEDVGAIISILFLLIVGMFLTFCMTNDSRAIDFIKIEKAESVCKNHGGLLLIQHDYDFMCKDGLDVND